MDRQDFIQPDTVERDPVRKVAVLNFLNRATLEDILAIEDTPGIGYDRPTEEEPTQAGRPGIGIGEVVAQRLLARRDALGGFKSVYEFITKDERGQWSGAAAGVPGFGLDKFTDLVNHVYALGMPGCIRKRLRALMQHLPSELFNISLNDHTLLRAIFIALAHEFCDFLYQLEEAKDATTAETADGPDLVKLLKDYGIEVPGPRLPEERVRAYLKRAAFSIKGGPLPMLDALEAVIGERPFFAEVPPGDPAWPTARFRIILPFAVNQEATGFADSSFSDTDHSGSLVPDFPHLTRVVDAFKTAGVPWEFGVLA